MTNFREEEGKVKIPKNYSVEKKKYHMRRKDMKLVFVSDFLKVFLDF